MRGKDENEANDSRPWLAPRHEDYHELIQLTCSTLANLSFGETRLGRKKRGAPLFTADLLANPVPFIGVP